jgi:flagellar hook protein FlgE
LGGINPTQVGLGVNIGAIAQSFTQGALQSTGRDLDLAIQGDGFFVYSDSTYDYFSREGSLGIDSQGYMVNSGSGDRIQGWQADTLGVVNTGNPRGPIRIPVDSTVARTTQNAMMYGNLDSALAVGETYTTRIGVYDSLGVLHPVDVEFTRTAANDWDWTCVGGGAGSGSVTFDTNGQYLSSNDGPITVTGSPGSSNFDVSIESTNLTMLASASSATLGSQDGLASGTLIGYSVSSNTGEVFGVYSNGEQRRLAQLAMAMFINPAGLIRRGYSRYVAGLNSGEARIGACGTGGRGLVSSGYLEGSNVDMSREFANMILAQRGFQASSRVISTSDEMLNELVNLRR